MILVICAPQKVPHKLNILHLFETLALKNFSANHTEEPFGYWLHDFKLLINIHDSIYTSKCYKHFSQLNNSLPSRRVRRHVAASRLEEADITSEGWKGKMSNRGIPLLILSNTAHWPV